MEVLHDHYGDNGNVCSRVGTVGDRAYIPPAGEGISFRPCGRGSFHRSDHLGLGVQ